MRPAGRLAIIAASLGSVLAAALAWSGPPPRAAATAPVWTEMAWPFPNDPWGKGKAFRCGAAHCGAEVNVYLRAKSGFCNCTTGVAVDDDVARMGDLVLVGDAGRAIAEADLGAQIDVHLGTAVRSPAAERLSFAPGIGGEGPRHLGPHRHTRGCCRMP